MLLYQSFSVVAQCNTPHLKLRYMQHTAPQYTVVDAEMEIRPLQLTVVQMQFEYEWSLTVTFFNLVLWILFSTSFYFERKSINNNSKIKQTKWNTSRCKKLKKLTSESFVKNMNFHKEYVQKLSYFPVENMPAFFYSWRYRKPCLSMTSQPLCQCVVLFKRVAWYQTALQPSSIHGIVNNQYAWLLKLPTYKVKASNSADLLNG